MSEKYLASDEPPPDDGEALLSRRQFVVLGAVGVGGAVLAARGNTAPPQDAPPSSAHPLSPIIKNRTPLQAIPFLALPLGSVKARGWVRHQLELQRDGLTGHAEKLLPAVKSDSAWLGGTGEDWEKGPYYVKGLLALAYTLDDAALKQKAQKWVEAMLASQRSDGFFGPKSNDDWWPRMVATYLLRDYADATGDNRVVPLLTRYYQYMAANLPKRPLREWGRARAGDEIDTIFWLYNRTGDGFLLALSDLLAQQAYPWRDILTHNRFLDYGQDFHPKHNVNVPQAMKLPPVYWQRSGNPADRAAFTLGAANLMRDHGLSVGMNSGTEFLAGRSSTQGIELCSIVERMLSDETALRILGDAGIGDNLERLAFNALPAALSKDIRQHVYFTLPNNPTAPRGGIGFTQDYDDARTPAPRSGFPCCCYNFHMGWPKLVQNAWAATPDGGLAALAYVPSEVSAPVAGGSIVQITSDTHYPFEDTIRLTVRAPRPATFPLVLRIPIWCASPVVSVNGRAQPTAKPGTFATIRRTWKNSDTVILHFPMTVRTVPGINDSVSVWRGPLVYSLKIAEHWQSLEKNALPGFDAYQVTPTSPWNYGLVLGAQPSRAFRVTTSAMPANPFDPAHVPIRLQVTAKRLPSWTLARGNRVSYDPPISPVRSSAPTETVTLVPFGGQMLRISDFPVVGTPRPTPARFQDDFVGGHADAWITYGGSWQVQNGTFGPTSDATSSHAVATRTRFHDFVYEADVSVSPTGDAGLIFRVSDSAIGRDNYNGYYVGLSAKDGEVKLGKAGGAWHPLQTARYPVMASRPQRVRIEARGPRLRVWVENLDTPLLDVTDTTFAGGAIGVRQYGADGAQRQSTFARIRVRVV